MPFLPEVIGIVTSPSGAVIRDVLNRLSDRFPRRVLLSPVAVQGEGAFRYFGRRPLIEDNSVTSRPTTLVDLRLGYKFSEQARLWLDILNLFNNTGAR